MRAELVEGSPQEMGDNDDMTMRYAEQLVEMVQISTTATTSPVILDVSPAQTFWNSRVDGQG